MADTRYTAGVAKISVVPDLSRFKRDLERQVKEHLKEYTLEVKPDEKEFGKLKELQGKDAKERSKRVKDAVKAETRAYQEQARRDAQHRKAVERADDARRRKLRRAENDAYKENFRRDAKLARSAAATKAQAAKRQRIQANYARIQVQVGVDPGKLTEASRRVKNEIVRHTGEMTAAVEKAAREYQDRADREDSRGKAVRQNKRTVENSERTLDKAKRNLAASMDSRDQDRIKRDTEALKTARNNLAKATETLEQSELDLARAQEKTSKGQKKWLDSYDIPAGLIQRRKDLERQLGASNQRIRNRVATSNMDEVNQLKDKLTRGRSVDELPRPDRVVIKDLILSAKELDAAEKSRIRTNQAVRQAIDARKVAQLALNDAEKAAVPNLRAIKAAEAARAAADDRVVNTLSDRKAAVTRVRQARAEYAGAKAAVQDRVDLPVLKRLSATLTNSGFNAFGHLNEKILLTGRYLAAVGSIARTATIAVAALGAVNLVPLIAAAMQAVNAFALIPAALTAAGAGIAALVIGSSGVMGAFKAATKETKNQGKEQERAAKQQAAAQRGVASAQKQLENANRGVEDSQRGVEDAYRDAEKTAVSGQKSIARAEEDVVNAQKNSMQAQKDLTRARKDAADHIRDLNDALKGTALDEEDAMLAIERARERLTETRRDPKATSLDRREADLGLRRAIQNLEQVRKRNKEMRAEAVEANKIGVSGAEGVVAAQEKVADATKGVKDAQEGVTEARQKADEANADAQRRIADAQRQLTDSQDKVVDAQQGIVDAQERLAEVVADSGSSVDAYNEALQKLSPNAKEFVETTRSLGDQWKKLREAVQDNLFEGLGDSVRVLALTHLPILKAGLSGIAHELNGGIRDSMSVLSTGGNDFARTLTNTIRATGALTSTMGPLTRAWMDIVTVGSDYLPRLSQELGDVLSTFARKVGEARASGRLNEIFESGIDTAKQLGRIVADVFGSIRAIFQAVRGEGKGLLDTFEGFTDGLRTKLKSPEGQRNIRDFFDGIRDSSARLFEILSDVAKVFTTQVFPAMRDVGSVVGPVITAFADLVSEVLTATPLLRGLLTVFLGYKALGFVGGLIKGISDAFGVLRTVGGEALDAIKSRSANGDPLGTSRWGRVKDSINNAADALGGWSSIALTAGVGAALAIGAGLDDLDRKFEENRKIVEQHKQKMVEYRQDLQDALASSGGVTDAGVIQVMQSAFESDKAELQTKIDNRPSWWNTVTERLRSSITPGHFSLSAPRSDKNNDDANRAEVAQKALNEVSSGLSNRDFANILTSTDGSYDNLVTKLRGMEGAGSAAIDVLEPLRREFLQNRDGAAAFAQVLKAVEMGSLDVVSATDQLTAANARQRGEQMVLADAQRNTNGALADFVKLVQGGFNTGLVDAAGEINTATEAGRDLYDQLGRIASAYDQETNAAYNQAKARGMTEAQAVQEARNAGERIRQAMYAATDGSKEATDAVDNLIQKYNLTDTTVTTRFNADVDPATNKVREFLNSIPATKEVSIEVKTKWAEIGQAAQEFGAWSPEAVEKAGIFSAEGLAKYREQWARGETPAQINAKNNPNGQPGPAAAQQVSALPPQMVKIKEEWQAFVDSIDGQFKAKVQPALDGINTAVLLLAETWTNVTAIVGEQVKLQSDAISSLADAYEEKITKSANPDLDSLLTKTTDVVTTIVGTVFPSLIKGLGEVAVFFGDTVKGIDGIWQTLKPVTAAPVNWVIDNVVNIGLKNAWNAVRAVIPSLAEWTLNAERVPGYHTGGIMSGYSPGRDDRIIAVGGGEAVMRPEWVRAMGSDYINDANAAARSGGIDGARRFQNRFMGAFANGGIVDAMTSAVLEKFPMMSMTSGLRFTDSGYHSKGMAADFSNGGAAGTPEMNSLANWIADNFGPPKTLQLIHSPFGRNIGQGVGWVGDGMGFYGAGTMDGHRDHVHWASDQLVSADGTSAPAPGVVGQTIALANARIKALWSDPIDALRKSIPDWGTSLFGGELPRGLADAVIGATNQAISKHLSIGSVDAGVTPFDLSAGVEQWRPNVIEALKREGFEPSDRNVNLTLAQMQTESSGNPNIIQQVLDVNSGGNEAVGLMQVTPGTFATYRNPDLPNDRTNPDASLSAALRWYRHAYGDDLSQQWGQGHGYDQGGVFESGTWGINASGKPEAVLTNKQWVLFQNLIHSLEAAQYAQKMATEAGLPIDPALLYKDIPERVKKLQEAMKQAQDGARTGPVGADVPDPTVAAEQTPISPDGVDLYALSDEELAKRGISREDLYPVDETKAQMATLPDFGARFAEMGRNFLNANVDQFKSDLGITGQGALSQLVQQAGPYVNQAADQARTVIEEHIHYHVADMDEAIRKEKTRQMQAAKSYFRR